MCGRFVIGGDFRDKLNELIASEGILPSALPYRESGQDGLILLAGLYHEEQGVPRYTILTTQANESMQPVHDRMPVMISRDEIGPWLQDNNRLAEFLERPQVQLVCEQDSGQIRMDWGL